MIHRASELKQVEMDVDDVVILMGLSKALEKLDGKQREELHRFLWPEVKTDGDFMVKRMNVIIKSTLSIVEMLREGMPPEAIEYLKNKIRGAVN